MNTNEITQLVIEALDDIKALDIKAFDVKEITQITDVMIVCTGTSNRHVKAIADNIIQFAKNHKVDIIGYEGETVAEWILVDLADVVVHVMLPTTREYYHLESLWDNTENEIKLIANLK